MPKASTETRSRWYSVSVDTLRLIAFPLVALAVVGIGFLGYTTWNRLHTEQATLEILAEVEGVLKRLPNQDGVERFRDELQAARANFQEANQAMIRGEIFPAHAHAVESLDGVNLIRGALGDGQKREAQFYSVQGGVEFRRGERGRWQPARSNVTLRPGDWVRTSRRGSARIMFPNGNLLTLRKESQIVVTRDMTASGADADQAIRMEYGWVDLNTRRSAGRVTTPRAEARVEKDSDAYVSFDRDDGTSRFGTLRGGLQVESADGESRRVSALQQVTQRGRRLSQPTALPAAPRLTQPPDKAEVNWDQQREITLAWQPVDGVGRYVLQVSDSHLFGDNIIEDTERFKTSAKLGVRGEGSFYWRVAARRRDGSLGPWSPTHNFRVVSHTDRNAAEDRTPPDLAITSVTNYGSLVLVSGKTEPGVDVRVNDEPANVEADGSFTKFVAFDSGGPAEVRVFAWDAWGNMNSDSKPVRVENP